MTPQFVNFLLIPHPHELRILVISTEHGWTLPFFRSPEPDFAAAIAVNQAAEEILGVKTAMFGCFVNHFDEATEQGTRFYALDNLSPDKEEIPGAVWLPQGRVNSFGLANPDHRSVIHAWFDWMENDAAQRADWAKRGWFHQARDWMIEQLDRLGIVPSGPVEQLRAWSRSCVLRVPTSEGWVYLKDVADVFSYEPVITRVIAQRHPGCAPDVLVVDVARSWMLMRDMGGEVLSAEHDLEKWQEAIRLFAAIQIDMTKHTRMLISLGCPDHNLDHLSTQIERLMANLPAGLTQEEMHDLMQIAPVLQKRIDTLLDRHMPLTLGHGDFWSGNVIIADENIHYYDWSDSCITHPFFDLTFFLSDLEARFPDSAQVRDQLRDIYLESWQKTASLDFLRETYQLARPLAFLQRAVVYHETILPGLEPVNRWEMAGVVPAMLRRLLQILREEE